MSEEKLLITWKDKEGADGIYFPKSLQEAEEYISNLIWQGNIDIRLWSEKTFELFVKINK